MKGKETNVYVSVPRQPLNLIWFYLSLHASLQLEMQKWWGFLPLRRDLQNTPLFAIITTKYQLWNRNWSERFASIWRWANKGIPRHQSCLTAQNKPWAKIQGKENNQVNWKKTAQWTVCPERQRKWHRSLAVVATALYRAQEKVGQEEPLTLGRGLKPRCHRLAWKRQCSPISS